ncbi:hypothetical protein [Spirillospora sp. CA-294931]|uniref:hypothetical protein n=1 Tax=Spirillospora sp. CA-294931 TaxID=3240042 RepID=UPI003D89CECE
MSTSTQRFDRAAAERLLSGVPSDPTGVSDPLARLLGVASARAQADELDGEDAAVAAFRAAVAAGPQEARTSRLPLARLFSAKIAALGLAVTAAGGTALAVTTGTLPDGLPGDHPRPSRPSSPQASFDPKNRPSNAPGTQPGTTPGTPNTGRTTKPGPTPQAAPNPAVVKLCQVYLKGKPAHRKRAFDVLVPAAGGPDKVAAYCGNATKNRPEKGKQDGRPGGHNGNPPDNKGGNGGGHYGSDDDGGDGGEGKDRDRHDDGRRGDGERARDGRRGDGEPGRGGGPRDDDRGGGPGGGEHGRHGDGGRHQHGERGKSGRHGKSDERGQRGERGQRTERGERVRRGDERGGGHREGDGRRDATPDAQNDAHHKKQGGQVTT